MRRCSSADEAVNRMFKVGIHRDVSMSNKEYEVAMMNVVQGVRDLFTLAIPSGFRSKSGSRKAMKKRIGLMVEGQKTVITHHFKRVEAFRCCVESKNGQEHTAMEKKIMDVKEEMRKASKPLDELVAAMDKSDLANIKQKAERVRDIITKTLPKLSKDLRDIEDKLVNHAYAVIAASLNDSDELTAKVAKMFAEPASDPNLDDLR